MHILCNCACVVGMPSKDTIKVVDEENYAIRTPKKLLWRVTPQCFEFDLVKKAYEKMMENDDGKVTDDAMVVETYGNVPVKFLKVVMIIKPTPEDVRLATNLVRVRKVFHKLHVLHDKLIYLQMKAYKKRFTEYVFMERYRSGHNEAVLKTVCPQGRVGSNPTLSVHHESMKINQKSS